MRDGALFRRRLRPPAPFRLEATEAAPIINAGKPGCRSPKAGMPLTNQERYSRQVLFGPIGPEGQARLAAARVVVVGCGATGSALAALLARAGVGRLRIVDRDYVEPSNLQRQSLFDEADAADSLPKAVAAARKIAQINSSVAV